MATRKDPKDEAIKHAKQAAKDQRHKATRAKQRERGAKAVAQVRGKQVKELKLRKDGVYEHYNVSSREAGGGPREVDPVARGNQNKINEAFKAGAQHERNRASTQTKIYPGSPGGNRPDVKTSSDEGGTGERPPTGFSTRGYKLGSNAVTNRRQVAGLASDIYNQLMADGGIRQDKAQQYAAQTAIDSLTAQDKGKDLSEVSVGSVMQDAFGTKARKMSKTERESGVASGPGGKNMEQRLQDRLDKRTGRVHYGQNEQYKGANVEVQGPKPKLLKPGQAVKKSKTTTREYLRSASPDEAQWIEAQHGYVRDEKTGQVKPGLFHGARGNDVPGAYRRWQRYVAANEEGYKDRSNVSEWLTTDMRGKAGSTSTDSNRRYKSESDEGIQKRFTGGVTNTEGTTANNRFKSFAPSHEDFGVGIKLPAPRSKSQLKKDHPDATDDQIAQMRDSDIQSIQDLVENQRMAHEARIQTMLGKEKGDSSAKGDRVVFFTTSVGSPAVSVSANSTLGQYIIRKRKKLVVDNKLATRAQVKGEYPQAVRDQHIVEVATGINLGAQGRYGVFKHTGWRAGSKASKGYGKMQPVGSQVLTDNSGQAMYDRNGNLRYTDGYTRPFDIRPSNELGLRIYLG